METINDYGMIPVPCNERCKYDDEGNYRHAHQTYVEAFKNEVVA